MTHSWIGLTISWCLYHSRYEVWHKCDRENRLIWLYFWPPNLSKSWLWSMYVRHLVPGDVSEQLLLSTKWLVGENCVFLLAKSCFSASPLYRRNCLLLAGCGFYWPFYNFLSLPPLFFSLSTSTGDCRLRSSHQTPKFDPFSFYLLVKFSHSFLQPSRHDQKMY